MSIAEASRPRSNSASGSESRSSINDDFQSNSEDQSSLERVLARIEHKIDVQNEKLEVCLNFILNVDGSPPKRPRNEEVVVPILILISIEFPCNRSNSKCSKDADFGKLTFGFMNLTKSMNDSFSIRLNGRCSFKMR